MPSPIGHALAGVAVSWFAERLPAPARLTRPSPWTVTALCAALAAAPDLDLVYPPIHRTATHSIGAIALVMIITIVVTGRVRSSWQSAVNSRQSTVNSRQSAVNSRRSTVGSPQSAVGGPELVIDKQSSAINRHPAAISNQQLAISNRWAFVFLCTAAYASHLLLDWLGTDPSLPAGIQALWPFSDRWYISGLNLFPHIERQNMLSAASILINIKAIAGELAIMGPIVAALAWLRRSWV